MRSSRASFLHHKAVRRLAWSALVLVAVSVLAFVLADLAPGDAFAESRLDPRLSTETVDVWRARHGVEDPLPARYGRWLASVARGDMGYSIVHRRSVSDVLWPRVGATLALTASAMLVAWAVALALGAWAARRPGGLLDRGLVVVVAALQSIPELLLALGGLVLAFHFGLPLGSAASLDAAELPFGVRVLDRARHALVPVLVLAIAALPVLVRHVRVALADALSSGAVRAARGHGVRGWRLIVGYVAPTAAPPLVSLFGISIGALVSGSLIVETVLGWPGLGPLMLEAVERRDLHVVVAGTLLSTAFLLAGNVLADLVLEWLEPEAPRQPTASSTRAGST